MKESAIYRERAVVAHHQAAEVSEPGVGAFDDTATPVSCGWSDAARSVRFRAVPAARATDRCRRLCRRSPASVSAEDALHDDTDLRGSSRASFPRAGLPPGMQSEGTLPKEYRGRRPPPSTSSPCPAWFFRLRSPFFRGSKAPVQERFAPL